MPTVRRPQEILTIANALLGQGQLSLAKYLLIVAREDDLVTRHSRHRRLPAALARARRLEERPAFPDPDDDRHARLLGPWIQPGLEGRDRRRRARDAARSPPSYPRLRLPDGFREPRVVLPGILAIQAGPYRDSAARSRRSAVHSRRTTRSASFPLIVIVDDSDFVAAEPAKFPLGDIHPLRSRRRHRRNRFIHREETLGLHGPAGDRRPDQAAPRSAAGRRSRDRAPRRPTGRARAARSTASTEQRRGSRTSAPRSPQASPPGDCCERSRRESR